MEKLDVEVLVVCPLHVREKPKVSLLARSDLALG